MKLCTQAKGGSVLPLFAERCLTMALLPVGGDITGERRLEAREQKFTKTEMHKATGEWLQRSRRCRRYYTLYCMSC